MRHSRVSTVLRAVVALALAASLLTACDGGGDDATTPPPIATGTPVPAIEAILPAVESGSGPAGNQVSPLATPDPASPLPSPTP
jgi:hypothetical protein